MEIVFYLLVLLVLFFDTKDLVKINKLHSRRMEHSDVLQKEKSEIKLMDKNKAIKFVVTTLETYTYWIVMVVGLFTDQWSIFLSLIILTYISGAVADKLENNIKKFRAYFIFDKLVSLILLIIVLVQRWNTI